MNIALIFAIICGIFVATVFALVIWVIINGLKDEALYKNQTRGKEADKPE